MAIGLSQTLHAEQVGDAASANGKTQGTLKADGKEHAVHVLEQTESVSEDVARFLEQANTQEAAEDTLLEHQFIPITQETIERETEIEQLFYDLQSLSQEEGDLQSALNTLARNYKAEQGVRQEGAGRKETSGKDLPKNPSSQNQSKPQAEVHSSIFSMASSYYTKLSQKKESEGGREKTETQTEHKKELRAHGALSFSVANREQAAESKFDREGHGKQEREKEDENKEGKEESKQQEFSQNQQKKRESRIIADKKQTLAAINKTQMSKGEKDPFKPHIRTESEGAQAPAQKGPADTKPGSIENIYIRFMALMARILGQAEMEAHQLYLKIKERTDSIDVLTLLMTKINSEKGAIDWSNNEEMKKLVDKARALGVDIPEGKYKWSEEEKKLLKENIQMRKDSMEKMTQLERTDMQRYLQEASQCHQARSNVLKQLKEVIDTIIHNMRPS